MELLKTPKYISDAYTLSLNDISSYIKGNTSILHDDIYQDLLQDLTTTAKPFIMESMKMETTDDQRTLMDFINFYGNEAAASLLPIMYDKIKSKYNKSMPAKFAARCIHVYMNTVKSFLESELNLQGTSLLDHINTILYISDPNNYDYFSDIESYYDIFLEELKKYKDWFGLQKFVNFIIEDNIGEYIEGMDSNRNIVVGLQKMIHLMETDILQMHIIGEEYSDDITRFISLNIYNDYSKVVIPEAVEEIFEELHIGTLTPMDAKLRILNYLKL